jgi:hypothetical protein
LHRATDRFTREVDMLRHHHRLAFALALGLTLAAAAPAAARYELNTSGAAAARTSVPTNKGLCSEVCGARGYKAATRTGALPQDPWARAVALSGAGYGYGNTPPASGGVPIRSEVVSGGGYASAAAPATAVHVVHPDNGFDWGDAGIGAGAALALMLLLGAGALGAVSIRRAGTSAGRLEEPERVPELTH